MITLLCCYVTGLITITWAAWVEDGEASSVESVIGIIAWPLSMVVGTVETIQERQRSSK